MMKRISLLLCILLLMGLVAGCNTPTGSPFAQQTQKQTQAQTPEPTAAVQTVNDVELTIDLAYGRRTGIYSGQMVNGLPDGQGSYTTTNDEGTEWTYQGKWVQGRCNGYGETVWADGWSEKGTYVNDYMTEGESYYNGSMVHRGSYLENQYNGQGTTYDEAGNEIFTGEFRQGYLVENEEDRITRADCIAPIAGIPTIEDYNGCLANPNAYFGVKVLVYGTVEYIWDADPEYPAYAEFIIAPDGDEYYPIDVYYRYGWDEQHFEEGEWVSAYGIFVGVYTYTGTDGNEYSMPMVEAHVVFHEEYNQ